MVVLTDIIVPPMKSKRKFSYDEACSEMYELKTLENYIDVNGNDVTKNVSNAKGNNRATDTSNYVKGNDVTHGYFKISNVTVLGETQVGKTSLIERLAGEEFSGTYTPTIGVTRKNFRCTSRHGRTYYFRFLETNDVILDPEMAVTLQDRLDSTHARYSDTVVIVYDIANHASFECAKDWVRLAKDFLQTNARLVLVGNKSDSKAHREVHKTAGEVFAMLNNMDFVETSCSKGHNLTKLLRLIAK